MENIAIQQEAIFVMLLFVILCYYFLYFLSFLRLRKDLEEAAIQQEATILSLKKKHQDAIAEMSEQIDQLNKLKTKAETEKAQ